MKKILIDEDRKKMFVVPEDEYIELLSYKGKYEAMKEAYEKLLKEIEIRNNATLKLDYPTITYGPSSNTMTPTTSSISYYDAYYGNGGGTTYTTKSEK